MTRRSGMIRSEIRRHIERLAAAAAELPAILLGVAGRGARPNLRFAEVKAKTRAQSRLDRRQGAGKWATD